MSATDQQLPTSCQELQRNGNDVSLYRDNELDQITFAHGMREIKKAFPELPAGWFDVLKKRCREKGFTNIQFRDAVNNLIDTCVYPKPTIANVLTWDRRIEIFTEYELMKKYPECYVYSSHNKGYMKLKGPDPLNEDYAKVKVNGQIRHVRKEYADYFERVTKENTKANGSN